MVDIKYKRIEIKSESLSENVIILTQSILIQGWQRTLSQTFHFIDSKVVQIIECIFTVFIDNFRNISTNSTNSSI